MNNRQGKGMEEWRGAGWCGREGVNVIERRFSPLICRVFIWQLHRSGESVGYGCSGVVAGHC